MDKIEIDIHANNLRTLQRAYMKAVSHFISDINDLPPLPPNAHLHKKERKLCWSKH